MGEHSVSEFVGRAGELGTFEAAIDGARAGVPTALLVGGDAGIGKSTLVVEGARRAAVQLIVGRCLPMGGDLIPLAPVAEILRSVRRADDSALSDPALAPLGEWISPSSAAVQPPAGSLFAPLAELFGTLGADDAVVVAFEDLHWADPLTWNLFDFLSRNLLDEHVVLVGTYRSNEVAADPDQRRRLGELSRLPAVRRVPLDGLSRDELEAKVRALVDGEPSSLLVDEIFARGQGNPFFSAELVAAHLNGEAIPAVLSDLVASDLGRLDAPSRSVVDAIAVVGRDVDDDLLRHVVDLDPNDLETALHHAIDAQFVVVDRETRTYRFRHALIGEVLYDELLPPERQRLHHRIAKVLASQPSSLLDRADRASELALHLDEAGDDAAAFAALLRAVDVAETVAPAAAFRQLERALELWDQVADVSVSEDRSARLWQAAELAAGAAGNQQAADLAREAFGHGDPPRGAAWGHERLGRYLWAAGHLEDSAEQFSLAAELLPDEPGVQAAAVHAGLGQAELMLGDYHAAETLAQRVVDSLGTSDADPAAWAMAQRVLGIVVDHQGDPARGVELCRAAVESAPNAVTRMLARLYLGVALMDVGAYESSIDEVLDARAEAQLTGLDRSYGGYLRALAVEGLVRSGRCSEADALLQLEEGTEAFPLGELRLALAGALAASRRGDRDLTHALLREAQSHPIDPFHRWLVDRSTADAHLVLGEWADAASTADQALERRPPALWRARLVMIATIADVELDQDARARLADIDLDSVRARVQARLDGASSDVPDPSEAGPTPDIAAHLAHASAAACRLKAPDPDQWASAASAWQQLGDPYWTATAHLGEAEAAAAQGVAARAADALRAAHALALGLDARRLLADIEAFAQRARLSLDDPAPVVLAAGGVEHLGLTPREADVLSLVAAGRTNREIGTELFISEKTASVHVSNILRKLGVTSRVDAAAVAQRLDRN